MNKLFFSIKNNYRSIETKNIISVKLNDNLYLKNQFKSMSDFYDFLVTNRYDFSYIEYEGAISLIRSDEVVIYQVYLENTNRHKLDGPAVIELIGTKKFGKFIQTERKEKYFIDDKELEFDDFKKHNKVRKAKLKRILKN